jgi:hypothetical protein
LLIRPDRYHKLIAPDDKTVQGEKDVLDIGLVIERGRDNDARKTFGMGKAGGCGLDEGSDIYLVDAVREFRVT